MSMRVVWFSGLWQCVMGW